MMGVAMTVPLVAQSAVSAAECLGVAIDTQNGQANLMWVDVYGAKGDLAKVAGAAQDIGVEPEEVRTTPKGDGIHIPFVSPRVSAAKAVALITRVRKGEFGSLTDKLAVMGIETLPADKCPRS